MGFSGGGSNILKPHTHDSTILQDGGNLNFQNITQSNMSAGSMTFSDGTHLQEFSLGGAGGLIQGNAAATAPAYLTLSATPHDQLRVNAGATQLEYFTPATPTSVLWEELDRHVATTNESTYTFTPGSALDLDSDYNCIMCTGRGMVNASLALQLKINNLTEYHTTVNENVNGTFGGFQDGSATAAQIISNSLLNGLQNSFNYQLYISKAKSSATEETAVYWGFGSVLTRGFATFSGGTAKELDYDITSIEMKTSTSTWDDDTLMQVFGLKQS